MTARVSHIESFRRVMQTEFGDEGELIRAVKGTPDAPNWMMLAGTAWHAVLDGKGDPYRPGMCKTKTEKGNTFKTEREAESVAADMRWRTESSVEHFKCSTCGLWHVGKPTEDEADLGYRVRSGDYIFDRGDIGWALGHVGPGACEVRGSKVYETRCGPILITGTCDRILGRSIRDAKAKFTTPHAGDYDQSMQWRLYLELFGADQFTYDLFAFSQPKDGFCALRDIISFNLFRYVGLEADCERWVRAFVDWAEGRGLMPFLHRESSDRRVA